MKQPPVLNNGHLLGRRAFIRSLALVSMWGPTAEVSRIIQSTNPQIEEFDFSSLRTSLTPNEDFFIRNHFGVPRLSRRNWRIHVTGRVGTPLEIDYASLLRLPSSTVAATLECAGNGVGAGGVSTAAWTGVALEKLLRQAGLRSGVKQIRLVGADSGIENSTQAPNSFIRSIPLEKAMHPDTLVAYQMNGAALPAEHGYPARVIVPGWYAMDSVKWLLRIEALDQEDMSYFMTRQYRATRLQTFGSDQYPTTRMRVKSQIARPRQGETLSPGSYTIRGAAWAGENGVDRVEISINGGTDWTPAGMEKNRRPYSWVLWEYHWVAERPGEYTVMVRATDGQGNIQPSSRDPLRMDRYELNWYHSVRCVVQ
jgi:DMSO/TMAO reductase YedYZ molybdopterin-dependent catalytic subunit